MRDRFLKAKFANILVFLLFLSVFLIGCISIVIWKRQKAEIASALHVLKDKNKALVQIENTLEVLFSAEQDFKQYVLNYNAKDLDSYRNQIGVLLGNIDLLQNMVQHSVDQKNGKAFEIIQERSDQVREYAKIRKLIDSLIVASSEVTFSKRMDSNQVNTLQKFSIQNSSIVIDTFTRTQIKTQKKEGIFGKIKTFIVGKEEKTEEKTDVVVKKSETGEVEERPASPPGSELLIQQLIEESNQYYHKQFQSIIQNQKRLREKEIALIRLNNSLMDEIKLMLNHIKLDVVNDDFVRKNFSSGVIVYSMSRLYIAFFIILLAILFLIIFVMVILRKLRKYHSEILASKMQIIKQAEEKDRFLAYLSHEFRTPLSSVLGFGRQLKQSHLNAEQERYLKGIISSSEIMVTSVNDILDLSKLDAGKMTFTSTAFEPVSLLENTVQLFELMAKEKDLALTYTHEGEKRTLYGDDKRLMQVLNNIISNAIKYTKKGSVQITSRIVNGSQNTLLLSVSVEDTGMGIDEAQLKTIFKDFSQVHTDPQNRWIVGTGLGLSIAQMLVEKMGGTIEVQSQKGKGSLFTFSIPYTGVTSSSKPKLENLNFLKDMRILVADDNDQNTALLKAVFEKQGASIVVSENGLEAYRLLEQRKFDVLITDMYMPQLNGMELTKRVRSHPNPSINQLPIIMLTGSISAEDLVKIKAVGIEAFLLKPYKADELFTLVKTYVKR